MAEQEPEHKALMLEAIAREGDGHRALLAGDAATAREAYLAAARAYQRSWELAGPTAYGRLIGMLKAAILAGEGRDDVAFVRSQVSEDAAAESAPAAYVRAVAALLAGDDDEAARWAGEMRAAGGAFDRTGAALLALARGDGPAYREALTAIVADFAQRPDHLTGVPIADTAAMLERLAEPRQLAARPDSPLLPVPTS
jgi:hypothetical protein